MNELLREFEKNGFFPENIVPDGRVHRFKRDGSDKGKTAWYVAHQNNSPNGGEVFFVAIFGDWSNPDNVYKYCSLKTQSTIDKKTIEHMISAAEKKRQKEQLLIWEECSQTVSKMWPTLKEEMTSPYFARKQIKNLNGAKEHNGIIIVPVVDFENKFWGLQKIYQDGKKMFLSGTRKRGNFHVLANGNKIETIYICEGYATASTIFEATGENVVVAFDAGNLQPVCEGFRRMYPEASIIVCGDDDVSDQPDKKNTGREAANAAASAVMGKALFPVFKSTENKPTDFNDLQVREGLEEVKKQILGVKIEKHYVSALGHKGTAYFYTSNINRQIVPTITHSAEFLTCLQPVEYWEQLYPTKTGIDWLRAGSDLKSRCHKRGIFNSEKVRGLGIWLDDERIVVHLGNRLWVDGEQVKLHELKTRHIYSLETIQPDLSGKPLEDCSALLRASQNIAWERTQDGVFFAGWLVAAMLSGVLQWRPHMWLIGGTGAGKSRIYEIIAKVMGGHVTTLAGGTTEAGLRRSVRGSALPLIFDEFELNDNATMSENQKILAFMRQASSDSVAQIVKADVGAGIVSYQPRFSAFVAGIRPSFTNEADRNRFTLIQLDRSKQNPEQWKTVKQAMSEIDENYSKALYLRCLSLIGVFRETVAIYEKTLSSRHYARFAQQFAPILAGYHILDSSQVITESKANLMIQGLELENEVLSIKDQNDEQDALGHLLEYKLRCGDVGERTVLEMIKGCEGESADFYNNCLQRHGLKYTEEQLFVSSKNPELSKIFDKTRFSINWNFSLSRIPDSTKNKVIRIFGKNTRGTTLMIKNFLKE